MLLLSLILLELTFLCPRRGEAVLVTNETSEINLAISSLPFFPDSLFDRHPSRSGAQKVRPYVYAGIMIARKEMGALRVLGLGTRQRNGHAHPGKA